MEMFPIQMKMFLNQMETFLNQLDTNFDQIMLCHQKPSINYRFFNSPANGAVILLAENAHSRGAVVTNGVVTDTSCVNLDWIAAQITDHIGGSHF